jgi:hypothetical protein
VRRATRRAERQRDREADEVEHGRARQRVVERVGEQRHENVRQPGGAQQPRVQPRRERVGDRASDDGEHRRRRRLLAHAERFRELAHAPLARRGRFERRQVAVGERALELPCQRAQCAAVLAHRDQRSLRPACVLPSEGDEARAVGRRDGRDRELQDLGVERARRDRGTRPRGRRASR